MKINFVRFVSHMTVIICIMCFANESDNLDCFKFSWPNTHIMGCELIFFYFYFHQLYSFSFKPHVIGPFPLTPTITLLFFTFGQEKLKKVGFSSFFHFLFHLSLPSHFKKLMERRTDGCCLIKRKRPVHLVLMY